MGPTLMSTLLAEWQGLLQGLRYASLDTLATQLRIVFADASISCRSFAGAIFTTLKAPIIAGDTTTLKEPQ